MNFLKLLKAPFLLLRDIIKLFIIYLPGSMGIRLRYLYYKNKFKSCGENVVIDVGVHIDGVSLISVGNNVHIDKYCIITTGKKLTGKIKRKVNKEFSGCEGEIIIGNEIHIAQFCILMGYGGIEMKNNSVLSSGCKVYSLTNTAYDNEYRENVISIMPYSQAPFLLSPIVFGYNVWMGLNSVVMPSVSIGQNSFCTSGSTLMSSFPENSYISGQPANRIRDRFSVSTNKL